MVWKTQNLKVRKPYHQSLTKCQSYEHLSNSLQNSVYIRYKYFSGRRSLVFIRFSKGSQSLKMIKDHVISMSPCILESTNKYLLNDPFNYNYMNLTCISIFQTERIFHFCFRIFNMVSITG